VQVEDVRLSRKVLYHFAICVIVNEILIFEDCRKEAYSAGPLANASAWRNTPAPSLSAREVVYCDNGYARYARAARCRLRFFLLQKNYFTENIIRLLFPHHLTIDFPARRGSCALFASSTRHFKRTLPGQMDGSR